MNVAPATMPRPPVRHVKAGSPDDNGFPCQWHQLDDERVSKAEQQDHMPAVGAPTKRQIAFSTVAYLCIVVGVIWLAKVSVTGRLF